MFCSLSICEVHLSYMLPKRQLPHWLNFRFLKYQKLTLSLGVTNSWSSLLQHSPVHNNSEGIAELVLRSYHCPLPLFFPFPGYLWQGGDTLFIGREAFVWGVLAKVLFLLFPNVKGSSLSRLHCFMKSWLLCCNCSRTLCLVSFGQWHQGSVETFVQ